MEQFYTIQGEGAYSGSAAWFLRLAGCDVGCVWCDVKESWDAGKHNLIGEDDLIACAKMSGSRIVVITGGEPCMYDLTSLTQKLRAEGLRVHLETSGAYEIRGDFDWICLSPKKFKFPLDSELPKAHEFKPIIFNKTDLAWALTFEPKLNPACIKLLQPEWGKSKTMLPIIIDFVKNNPDWRISLQTHKYLGIP
jgi:organic radical activating enzyme